MNIHPPHTSAQAIGTSTPKQVLTQADTAFTPGSVQFLHHIRAPCSLPPTSPHLHSSPMGPKDRQQTGNPDSAPLTCPPITHSTLRSFFLQCPTDSPTAPHCLSLPHLPVPTPTVSPALHHLSGPSREMDTLTPKGAQVLARDRS